MKLTRGWCLSGDGTCPAMEFTRNGAYPVMVMGVPTRGPKLPGDAPRHPFRLAPISRLCPAMPALPAGKPSPASPAAATPLPGDEPRRPPRPSPPSPPSPPPPLLPLPPGDAPPEDPGPGAWTAGRPPGGQDPRGPRPAPFGPNPTAKPAPNLERSVSMFAPAALGPSSLLIVSSHSLYDLCLRLNTRFNRM
jgi:hypothetical protein